MQISAWSSCVVARFNSLDKLAGLTDRLHDCNVIKLKEEKISDLNKKQKEVARGGEREQWVNSERYRLVIGLFFAATCYGG